MIRPAKPRDMAQLATLIEAHAEYEGFPFENGFENIEALERLACGHSTRLLMWVVEINDTLLGYMSATIDYSTWDASAFVYLDCLYLTEAARGLGFGRQLMDTLETFAAERSIPAIQWQTPPDNTQGLGFYRQMDVVERPKQRFTRKVPQSAKSAPRPRAPRPDRIGELA